MPCLEFHVGSAILPLHFSTWHSFGQLAGTSIQNTVSFWLSPEQQWAAFSRQPFKSHDPVAKSNARVCLALATQKNHPSTLSSSPLNFYNQSILGMYHSKGIWILPLWALLALNYLFPNMRTVWITFLILVLSPKNLPIEKWTSYCIIHPTLPLCMFKYMYWQIYSHTISCHLSLHWLFFSPTLNMKNHATINL